MSAIDYAIVVAYLVIVGGIGLAYSSKQETPLKYFLANRSMPQWVVGFTLMATLISSNTLVAHPAIVFQKSMVLVPGFIMLPIVLVIVARWIVPFYRRVLGMSAYEFIGARFGLGGRIYTSVGFLLSRTFGIGTTLVTTAIATAVMTGWPMEWVILGIGLFTVAYTMIGGITAVVWTDVVQGVFLMVGCAAILLRLVFAPEVESTAALFNEAWQAGKFSLGTWDISWSSLFNDEDLVVWMYMLAMTLQWSRRYVCDQAFVQRYLIARSDREATRGVIMGAALSVPVLLAFNLVGALLYGFYSLSGAAQPEVGDHILPHFIVNFLPVGLIGLILAAILAAAMSSISSDLNSISTVITRDYFYRMFPGLTDQRQLLIGRCMVLLAGLLAAGIAILLMPTRESAPLAERVLIISVIVSAGTLGVFCLGFLSTRATRRGSYMGIAACVLFTLWGVLSDDRNGIVNFYEYAFSMNPIMIGVFGNLISFGVGYGCSILFGGYRPERIEELTFRLGRKNSLASSAESA